MHKLTHKASCTDKPYQPSNVHQSADLPATDSSTSQAEIIKSYEGKLMLLEQRNKSLLSFYEQKISQLKEVLKKQNQTKQDLMCELTTLNHENKKQNGYVNQLKTLMEQDTQVPKRGLKSSQQLVNAQYNQKLSTRLGSRSRGKGLFASNNFGRKGAPSMLKRVKSSQYIESQYLMNSDTGKNYYGSRMLNPEHC